MTGAEKIGRIFCDVCGKPNVDVAYLKTGMEQVAYRHAACDRQQRELSASEERQEWSINQWLTAE